MFSFTKNIPRFNIRNKWISLEYMYVSKLLRAEIIILSENLSKTGSRFSVKSRRVAR